jgi:hypothetical protein
MEGGRKRRKGHRVLWGNPKERDILEDLGSTGGQLEETGWHKVD